MVDDQPDGKVKVELGDDPDRTGSYSFSFTLHNLTGSTVSCLLSAALCLPRDVCSRTAAIGVWTP
ncbi:MAG: hypothetical protein ACLU9S_11680 [Oscillospiraceae bacterium]